jgi:hypothetical protein
MRVTAFWNMAQCNFVGDRRFKGVNSIFSTVGNVGLLQRDYVAISQKVVIFINFIVYLNIIQDTLQSTDVLLVVKSSMAGNFKSKI